MVLMLIPVAVAYMHYKKKKRELEEAHANGDDMQETGLDDSLSEEERKNRANAGDTVQGDGTSSTQSSPRGSTVPLPDGPMGKLFRFCENLEKEVQKSQERKLQEFVSQGMQQRQQKSRADIGSFNEKSLMQPNVEQNAVEKVSPRARISSE